MDDIELAVMGEYWAVAVGNSFSSSGRRGFQNSSQEMEGMKGDLIGIGVGEEFAGWVGVYGSGGIGDGCGDGIGEDGGGGTCAGCGFDTAGGTNQSLAPSGEISMSFRVCHSPMMRSRPSTTLCTKLQNWSNS